MKKLTADTARSLLARMKENESNAGLTIRDGYMLQALEIALPVLEQEVIVPDGWRLVPAEPTEEMIAAGDQFMDGLSRLCDAYEAMLAAAPQPSTIPQIDNDGWIEWKGGTNPAEGKLVQVKYRESSTGNTEQSEGYRWGHFGNHDIIAYRVIESDGREG